MTTEIFTGMPDALKARLDAIIAGPATINLVIHTHIKGEYIIIYT